MKSDSHEKRKRSARTGERAGDRELEARRRSEKARKVAAPIENGIERVGARAPKSRSNVVAVARAEADASARNAESSDRGRKHDPYTVPEEVSRRFVNVGKTFYFPDGARAFTDHGRKLSTPSENTEVIRSLVSIAQSRGWKAVRVSGTDAFRRAAWFAAGEVGLSVQGFVPSELERAQLARKLSARAISDRTGSMSRKTSTRDAAGLSEKGNGNANGQNDALRGRLLEHGRAPYRHREGEPMSYYVKLRTANGQREVWGVDLERAIVQSLSQPRIGDEVALVRSRREPVTVKRRERDSHGKVIGEQERQVHRNQWKIETQSFFEARARAASVLRDPAVNAKQATAMHPELTGTYMSLRAAELASKRMRDREERARFVEAVRSAMADSVERGEPLAPVKLKERTVGRGAKVGERTRAPAHVLG